MDRSAWVTLAALSSLKDYMILLQEKPYALTFSRKVWPIEHSSLPKVACVAAVDMTDADLHAPQLVILAISLMRTSCSWRHKNKPRLLASAKRRA